MLRFVILGMIVFSQSVAAYDFNSWRYKSGRDKLNDDEYSYAYSKPVNYKYNDTFSIGFYCKNGRLRFEIDADSLIESKGKPFSFTYRVDKNAAQDIKMNTYSNNGQGGYSYDDASKVARDILGGNKIFVRAISWNNEYLEATIPLKASDKNIKKVFDDCGMSIAGKSKKDVMYSFSQFESDFNKLSTKKQTEILKLLQKKISKM